MEGFPSKRRFLEWLIVLSKPVLGSAGNNHNLKFDSRGRTRGDRTAKREPNKGDDAMDIDFLSEMDDKANLNAELNDGPTEPIFADLVLRYGTTVPANTVLGV